MTNTTNVPGDRSRYQDALESLDALDSNADADALRAWTNDRTVALRTRRLQLRRVALLSRRSVMVGGPPLTDMDGPDDVSALLADCEAGTHPDVKDDGLASNTLRQYRIAARNFFADGLGRDWADEINAGSSPSGPITRSDLLTPDECDALLDAADHPRDRALIAFLLATGQRITATLSIRVGDVDLNGTDGVVYLNDNVLELKGAAGPRSLPLSWATGAVGNWYAVHPRTDDPDAALFCSIKSGSGGDEENGTYREYAKGDPLSRAQAAKRLKRVAKRAGVAPPKATPHNLRHTFVTQMLEEDVPEQYIKWLVGWKKDSSQLERYAHLTSDRMMTGFHDARGTETGDDEIGRDSPTTCSRCNATLRASAGFCDNCGLALTQSAAAARRDDTVTDLAAPETTGEQREAVARLLDAIETNPEVAAAVADVINAKTADAAGDD